LRDETVKEHYDPARVSANINPVCSRVFVVFAVEWMFLGEEGDLLKKLIKNKNNKLNAK
jgi:hypothetical protein